MTHLHIPDGVLPVWLVVAGWVAAGLVIYLCSRHLSSSDLAGRVPRVAVMAALMILGMSVPLGIIPFHVNLTVLSGILLGARLGLPAIAAVNIILALMGHGGITVIGLNTLVTGTEVGLGSWLFRRLQARVTPGAAAATATALTLVVTFGLLVAIALASGSEAPWFEVGDEDHAAGHVHEVATESLRPLLFTAVPVFGAGVVIEAVIAYMVCSYLARVRPDYLELGR